MEIDQFVERQNIATTRSDSKRNPTERREQRSNSYWPRKSSNRQAMRKWKCKPVRFRRCWSHRGAPTVFAIAQAAWRN
jgi:hypothetical protein